MSRIKNDPPEKKMVKTDVETLKPKVKAAAVTKVPSKVFSDGMSNGKGSALRLKSANLLGGMPTVSSAPSTKGEGIRALSVGERPFRRERRRWTRLGHGDFPRRIG